MRTIEETEQRLVSACMAGGPICVAGAVGLGVSAESFSDPRVGRFWAGLVLAATEDKSTATFNVARRTFGTAIPPVEFQLLAQIQTLEPTSIYAKTLAEHVIGESKRRSVANQLAMALDSAKRIEAWPEAWSAASEAIKSAQQFASAHAVTNDLETLCDAYIAEEENGKPPGKVGTGIPHLDEQFGLVAAGEVVVIAGRPGVGKTALALQMADSVVRAGGRSVIISLEMSGKDLVGRLAKQRSGRTGSALRGCSKSEYQAAKATRILTAQEIKQAKGRLSVFEVQEVSTLSRIEDRVAMLASANQLPDCVVIDYLQLVKPEDARAPREQQVATISRKAKLMALEYRIPVILLSQLNRDAEKNDRRPRLSDLRESGSIEQDADRVWLLYPDPEVPLVAEAPTVQVVIEQAKNRNGPGGIAQAARFYKPAFIFEKL